MGQTFEPISFKREGTLRGASLARLKAARDCHDSNERQQELIVCKEQKAGRRP